MQERYLPTVIDMMMKEIPVCKENQDLFQVMNSVRESALYAAPEAMHIWWCSISNILESQFPDPNNLNEWQTKVVNIWMDKK